MVVRLFRFLQRENLHRLLLIIMVLMVLSTVGLVYFEKNITWGNALWWSIVTLTTVGYGDITPISIPGRLIGIIIMVFGIGILGMFTATIASFLVERKLKEDRGMNTVDLKGHLILCQWNHRAQEILSELRADRRTAMLPIVLIAKLPAKPVDDDRLFYIQGEVNEENLGKANLEAADTVIILGDDNLEANARDAQVVLATLTVESLKPEVYSIVELVDERNVPHCERAHANEIIVGAEFSSRLISRAALDHGISKVLSELLSSRYGNELFRISTPNDFMGKQFIDVFTEMKRHHNSTVLAVYKKDSEEMISNPSGEYTLQPGDQLVVIAKERPKLK